MKKRGGLWKKSKDSYEFDEVKYEVNRLKDHIELNKESITDYHTSRDTILAICNDMQNQNPHMKNDLTRIINELQENTKIVEQIHRGGGLTTDSTRLSSISSGERIPTTQGGFTEQDIQQRLERFTLVSADECFQLPTGIWIRYFLKAENTPRLRGLYRTGGFVIYKDPEKRYITLVSGHNQGSNPYTWSMQLANVHSIYAMKKNVRKFRYDRMDHMYGFRKGASGMLYQYIPYRVDYMELWGGGDTDIRLVLYDVVEHHLHTPRPNQKKKSFLHIHELNEGYVKQVLMSGLEYQFNNLTHGTTIVGLVHANDLPALRKRKSKLKQ
jgi:hypothetical protein